MKNVSSAFREELKKDNRNYIKSADITLKNGTVLEIDNSDLWQNGMKLDTATSSPNSFDLGAIITGQLTLTLNNIDEKFSDYDFTDCTATNVKVGLKLPDGTTESLSYGKFYLNEAKYNGSIITLTFYDSIYKFDQPYSKSSLSYPATLRQIVQDACSVCGVTLGTVTFDQDDFVVQERPDDSSTTFRQVLQWVGQIACYYFYADSQGRLSMKWYDLSAFEDADNIFLEDSDGNFVLDAQEDKIFTFVENGTIYPGTTMPHHNLASFVSLNTGLDDVVITGIKVIQEVDGESGGKEEISYQSGNDGYVLAVSKNKLIQGDSGNTIASLLGTKIIGMRFRTFSASGLSDPTIEAGDPVVLIDRKGNSYQSYITNNVFQPGAYQSTSLGAETPARKSATRYSQMSQVYVDYRKEIEKERTDREEALEELGEQIKGSGGLFTTIETQADGSKKYFMHNKPVLSESDIIWSMTAEAWGVSTDGGKTYNAGMTVDGDTIVRILTAVGVNADWIKTGALRIEKNGQVMLNADIDTGQVDIVANSFSLRGRSIDEIAEQQLSDFVDAVYDPAISNLQSQIDGQIETWFYNYIPTTSNAPANQWTTDSEKDKHLGDLFYIVDNEEYGGQAYRWAKIGSEYKWDYVEDTATVKALADAAKAQDTADQKRRVFITTPVPPYDSGDLWMQGTSGDIMTCVNSRQSGNYVSTDWEKKNKYTDDSAVTDLDESLDQESIFNRLTNNGQSEGLYLQNGHLYFNGTYIQSGAIQVVDDDGNIIFKADIDNHSVTISGDRVFIGDQPITENFNNLQAQIDSIDASENIYYGENLIKDPHFTKISGEGNMWAVNTGVHATRMGDDYEIKDPLGDSGKIMRIWKEPTASAGAFFGTKPTNNPVLPEDLQDGIFEFTFYARTENTGSGDAIWTTDIYVCVNGYYSSYKKITLNKLWHKYSIKLKCDSTRRSHISFGVAPVTSGESNAILLYKPECYYVGQDIKEGANLIRDPHFDTIKSPVSTGGMWTTPNSAGIDVRSYKTSCTHEFANPNMDTFKDPEGGYGALVVNNMSNGVSDCFVSAISNGNNPVITDAGMYRVSVWLKAQYSGKTLKLSLNRQTTDIELSTEWKEYSYVQNVETVNTQGYEMFTIGGFSSWGTNFGNLYIYNPRVEKLYSSEDTFNMLTDFGKKKGLYKIGDQLYFSFDYARGGTLKLGGSNNGNGLLEVYNSSGVLVGTIDNIGAKFTNGSDWLQISQSLLTGGYGSTTDGVLDLSANYSTGRHVVLESKTGDVVLKSADDFRVQRQSGGMGYLVQSGGTDYFDDIGVSFGDTYPVIGIMYGEDDISGDPFLDIRLSNGRKEVFSASSGSSVDPGYGYMDDPIFGTTTTTTLTCRSTMEVSGNIFCSGTTILYKAPQFFNVSHVTSGGHLVFASDGATVAYLSSSSKRYKNHVSDVSDEEALKILNIPVIKFKYKDGYLFPTDFLVDKEIPGFYAEDVEEVDPILCQYNLDGSVEDWNYRTMIPYMLKTMQIQQKRIDNLQTQINELKTMILNMKGA